MALSKNLQKSLMERLTLMDNAVDEINVEDIQEDVFKALKIFLFKELDLDKDGNIKQTSKNLRAINRVKKLRSIVLTEDYKAKVGKFIGTFNTVKSKSDEFIKGL